MLPSKGLDFFPDKYNLDGFYVYLNRNSDYFIPSNEGVYIGYLVTSNIETVAFIVSLIIANNKLRVPTQIINDPPRAGALKIVQGLK